MTNLNSREVARQIILSNVGRTFSEGDDPIGEAASILDSALLAANPGAEELASSCRAVLNTAAFVISHAEATSMIAAALESAKREAAPKWISVKERLPEHGQTVIYYFAPLGVFVGKYKRLTGRDAKYGTNLFYGPSGFLIDDVTHWMPLPPVDSLAEKEGGR